MVGNNVNIIVKSKLDEYLEFDSNLLFQDTDYLVIFGGVLRDIVSGDSDKINDIDILCLPESMKKARQILEEYGYSEKGLVRPDIHQMYKGIKCIFYPITYIKGDKIVQFIRPSMITKNQKTPNGIYETFFDLLVNVDLSSSGLFYDGEKVYESLQYSYIHCLSKVYITNEKVMMYSHDRIFSRRHRLERKGWVDLKISSNKLYERLMKLTKLRGYDVPSIHDFIKKIFGFFYYPKIVNQNMKTIDDKLDDFF